MTNFMEDKRFDKVIDEIVRDFEANYSSDSWRRLERKLDAEEKDNDHFDKMIAHKLNGYSIPLDTDSFSKFEDRLGRKKNTEFDFRWVKNIAAVIILMMYVTQMSNYYDDKPVIERGGQFTKTNASIPPNVTIMNPIDLENEPAINKKLTCSDHIPNKIVNSKINEYNSENAAQNFGIKYIFPSTDVNLDLIKNNFVAKNSLYVGNQENYDISNADILTADIAMHFEVYEMTDDKINNLNLEKNIQNDQNIAKLKTLNSDSPTNDSEQLAISKESDIFEYKVDNNISNPKKSIEISAFAAPSYCMISTPNDVDMGVPGYKNQAVGYETGINLGFKNSRHEFGSGIKLNSLNYSPKKIVVGENGKSFWLDEIAYKFIGIPLFYKYNYYSTKKTDLYITSTVQPDLMVYSDYKFIQNDVSGSLIKLAEELIETNDFKNTLYAAKRYKNGTFEGGKSNENFSLSMSVGLGLQTEIQNSYSFFIEPAFNYTLLKNDFGPNHDKLSFLSLKLGINKTIDL